MNDMSTRVALAPLSNCVQLTRLRIHSGPEDYHARRHAEGMAQAVSGLASLKHLEVAGSMWCHLPPGLWQQQLTRLHSNVDQLLSKPPALHAEHSHH